MRRPEIRSLTGVRFVAALGVVVYHFAPPITAMFPAFAFFNPLTSAGRYGVDLFFILSGFILTYLYLESFQHFRLEEYTRFLALRLARIYPLQVFTIAILVLAVVGAAAIGRPVNHPENYTIGELWKNVLLVHAWTWWDASTSWNYPSWSISAEWFAYVLFPLPIWLISRIRTSAGLAAGAAGAMVLQIVLAPLVNWSQDGNALVRISGEFLTGCFLARLYVAGWAAGWRWTLIAVGTMAALLAGFLLLTHESGDRKYLIPLFGVLILALARSDGWPSRWLANRFVVFWGEASYAIYMTHALIEVGGAKLFPMASFAGQPVPVRLGVLVLYMFVIFGFAAATYLVVERPSRDALRQVILQRRALPSTAAPVA